MTIARAIASPIARPIASPLDSAGGLSGLLDFLPPSLRVGGFAVGTSRLFGSYQGPLIRLRRGSDSVEQDAGASAARVTSADVTGLCGKNRIRQSNDFANSAWNKLRCTTSTKTPAVVGTMGVLTCSSTNAGGFAVNQTATDSIPASTITFSCVMEKGTNNFAMMFAYDGTNGYKQWWNLNTGAVASVAAVGSGWSKVGATITDLGSGLFRCTLALTAPACTPQMWVYPCVSADAGQTGTLGDVGNVAECQFEYGSAFTSYEARVATAASPCLVPKLYGQLGGSDAVQSDPAKIPRIIPRQIGEMPILIGDGVDDVLGIAGFMATLDAKDITIIQAGKNALCGNSAASRLYVGGAASSYDLADNLAHGNSGNRRVVSLRSEGAAQSARINGVEAATATQPQIATYGGTDFLLGQAGAVFGNPPLASLALPSAMSLATLAAVEAALISEYQTS